MCNGRVAEEKNSIFLLTFGAGQSERNEKQDEESHHLSLESQLSLWSMRGMRNSERDKKQDKVNCANSGNPGEKVAGVSRERDTYARRMIFLDFSNALSNHCTVEWVTRHERPRGVKDEVKQAQRPLPRSRAPKGPKTSSVIKWRKGRMSRLWTDGRKCEVRARILETEFSTEC